MTTTAHLQLMSKPRLIQIIASMEARTRQHAELADYWRTMTVRLVEATPKPDVMPSPETTWAEARRILRGLPVDPHAQEHRDTLRASLNRGGHPNSHPARCRQGVGSGVCGDVLSSEGFCRRCDRAAQNRAEVAA